MANLERYKQRRGLVAINGAMTLIVIFLVAQVWLLSATLETFLAGHTGAVLPAAIFSGLAFLGCMALNLFVTRVDQSDHSRNARQSLGPIDRDRSQISRQSGSW
jgi:hypothetical protein